MVVPFRFRLLLVGILAWSLGPAPGPEATGEEPPRLNPTRNLRPGLTKEQVRDRFGPPSQVARQVVHQRILEQWVYDRPWFLRLTFDRPRGRSATLLHFHRRDPIPR